MSSRKYRRFSAIAAAIGWPLFAATFLSHGFWRVLDAMGIADNDFIHPLLAEIGLLLMAIGLIGLYQRLPERSKIANRLALAISLVGILSAMVGALGLAIPTIPEIPFLFGIALSWLGIAVMGIITIVNKSLETLSFVPLAMIFAAILFALTFESNETVGTVFMALHMFCWVLLGYALWKSPQAGDQAMLSAQTVPAKD